MKRSTLFYLLIISLLTVISTTSRGSTQSVATGSGIPQLIFEIKFNREDLDLSTKEMDDVTYDQVRLPNTDSIQEAGEPELPVKTLTYIVPSELRVAGITIVKADREAIPGTFKVNPADPQPIGSSPSVPHPMESIPRYRATPPDPDIYASSKPYPVAPVKLQREGRISEWHVVCVNVYPLEYRPKVGQLSMYTYIKFQINLEPGSAGSNRTMVRPFTQITRDYYRRFLHAIISNPGDIDRFTPPGLVDFSDRQPYLYDPPQPNITSRPAKGDPPVVYLIITDESLAEVFVPLVRWKMQKGLPVGVATTQWIDANYHGVDLQERIRMFIQDAYKWWGLTFVLLGNDVEGKAFNTLVPVRQGWISWWDSQYIPTDLYYSDLDGDWNADGDAYFGEDNDGVDLYPDVFVGRAPISTPEEAKNFVTKVIAYEREPDLSSDPSPSALFMAGDLFQLCDDDAHNQNNYLANEVFPEEVPIFKLYSDHLSKGGDEELNRENAINRLNYGYELINHLDHCSPDALGTGAYFTGGGELSNKDTDNLTNRRLSILWTFGCDPNAFDMDCIAEHFVRNPRGGCVAFVGNTRAGVPYQYYQDNRFWKAIFSGTPEVGIALASTQGSCTSHSYLMNLLGDPETPAWYKTPGTMRITTNPEQLGFTGPQTVEVRVMRAGSPAPSRLPVVGAHVTLWKEDETYAYGLTNDRGIVILTVAPRTQGRMIITVTARNYLPYEDEIQVKQPTRLWVHYKEYRVEDRMGNGNGRLEAGESITLPVLLANDGTLMARDVTATLTVEVDAFIIVAPFVDGQPATPGQIFIGAGGIHPPAVPFLLSSVEAGGRPPYNPGTDTGYFIWTDRDGWHLRWGAGGSSHDFDTWLISWGEFREVYGYDLERSDGFRLLDHVAIRSWGHAEGDDEDGLDFISRNPGGDMVQVTDDTASFGNIYGGQTMWSREHFGLKVNPAFPGGEFIYTTLRINYAPTRGQETNYFELPVAAPELQHCAPNLIYDQNWNGQLEPGEWAELSLPWRNVGNGDADSVMAKLVSLTPWAKVTLGQVSIGNISAGAMHIPACRFKVQVLPDWTGQPDLTFAVEAWDQYGHTWRHEFELTDPPAAPQALTSLPERTEIRLAWRNNFESDLTGYWIYRDEPYGPNLLNLDSPAHHSCWLDSSLVRDQVYRYYVRAIDSSGNISPPSEVHVERTNPADQEGWPQPTDGYIWGSAAIARLGPKPRVLEPMKTGLFSRLLMAGSLDGKLYVWDHHGQLREGWPKEIGPVWASPAVSEEPHLSNREGALIVAAARVSEGPQVYVWDRHGTLLWSFNVESGIIATPVIARLTPETKSIIVAAEDGRVWAWDISGELLTGWPQETGRTIIASPAVADLDGDTDLEIVVGTWGLPNQVFAFHHDGTKLDDWPVNVIGRIWASPVLADLDGNGSPEVIVAADKKVYIFRSDSTPFPGWPRSIDLPIRAQPTVGNLDGNPGLEIVVGDCPRTGSGNVHAWHHDGTPVADWPVPIAGFGAIESAAAIGDLDGDGDMEVVVGADDLRVHAWHATGTKVAGFPIRTNYHVRSGPALGDLDNDGDIELATGSYDYSIYVFDLPGNPERLEWPMFRYNVRRTGQYISPGH
jgi:hypothetical protein